MRRLRSDTVGMDDAESVKTISTAGFAVLVLMVATIFTLYIGHVYATQELLNSLQQAQRENLRLHLQHNELKGRYDEATGPSVIHARAPALGLVGEFSYAQPAEAE